jgi:hypothetical protein
VKTESSVEIIEIIDEENDAFGQRAPARPVNDGGRHWVAPVTAAAMLSVIGYGVISSAISSRDATPSTPSTTPHTTATRSPIVPVSPAVTLVSPVYYVADPAPAGFTMHFAETLGMGGNTAELTDGGTVELWATPDATSTTGSWFAVSRGTHHTTGRNAYRTVVGSTEVVVEHDPPSGQSRLSFTKDGNAMEVTAFGWADRQLLRLVDSTYVAESTIRYHDPFFTTDHQLQLRTDPATAVYGLPVAWVGYTTAIPAGLAESFTITVAGYSSVDREVTTRFALRDVTSFTVGGLPAIVGHTAVDPRSSIVQFRDGERLITLRGTVDAPRLAAIAATVHPSPNADVAQLLDNSEPAPSFFANSGPPRTIASGMLADGWPWTIQVSARDLDDPAGGYLWGIGQPGDSTGASETRVSQAAAAPSIETIVEHGRTYVLAKVPRTMAGAELHVSPTGLSSTTSPMVDLDAGFGDLFTAYVFLEPVPFTAEIVDGSGTTVSSWPVTGTPGI